MIKDGYYRLTEQDGRRLLQLIGQLKEATYELLAHRYTIVADDQFDEDHSLAELTFYELAQDILNKGND